jgi:hypothetical protein
VQETPGVDAERASTPEGALAPSLSRQAQQREEYNERPVARRCLSAASFAGLHITRQPVGPSGAATSVAAGSVWTPGECQRRSKTERLSPVAVALPMG